MSQSSTNRTHVIWRAYRAAISTCYVGILASATFAFSFITSTSSVKADDSITSPHGAIFHRKGWLTPAIYKKRTKPSSTQRVAKQKPLAQRSTKNAPGKLKLSKSVKAQNSSTRKRSSKLRQAAKARLPKAKRPKRSTRRRIPARVVKQRERTIRPTAKRALVAPAYAVKVASLGVDLLTIPSSIAARLNTRKKSITGGGGRITWSASSKCLPSRLRNAINYVSRNFGRVRVNSTCRSRKRNRRVGGASRSWHLKGRAADIRVFGNVGKTARYLRRVVGGFKHYGGGLFHIDTGPRRRW